MERSKQNKLVVGNKDNGVDDSDDDSVDNGDVNSVDNSDDSDNKHLTLHLQALDCCLTERSKQNKH
eukprot:3773822-Ditylum_brightwellii.AAC.1